MLHFFLKKKYYKSHKFESEEKKANPMNDQEYKNPVSDRE